MDNNVILLRTKDGVKLTADKFVYQGITYPISTMKRASLKEGDYKSPDKLQIDFKGGATKDFFLKPTITFKQVLTQRLTTFSLTPTNVMQQNMVTQILEWVTKINELIKERDTAET